MNFPFSNYSFPHPIFAPPLSFSPTLSEAEDARMHGRPAHPPIMPYPPSPTDSEDLVFPPPYLAPSRIDASTMMSMGWSSQADHATLLHGSLVPTFPSNDLVFSPEEFLPEQYAPESTNLPYTKMFRGRKSKAAFEVIDELRPYACDICQAAFARSHDRDRHKRSHTGETPYRCHGCGTGFKRPDARKRHWERDPTCAQEDWLRVRHTPEGAKRRARANAKPTKKRQLETSNRRP